MASCQAKSKPHATGILAGARSAGWPASNETIVANPRRRRGARVASSRSVDWHSSNPLSCWLPDGAEEPRPHTEAAIGSGVGVAGAGVGIPTATEVAVIGSLEYTIPYLGVPGYNVLYTT